ncbi:MAG: GFA family protein [Pikeienuella sp.]
MTKTYTGSCHCRGVTYQVDEPLRDVVACHCEQCRKTSGHHVAATSAPKVQFRLGEDATLSWYRASDTARRGFCNKCGGNLFWDRDGDDNISIFAGTLDTPTGLTCSSHIFVANKSDYYDIPQGVNVRMD